MSGAFAAPGPSKRDIEEGTLLTPRFGADGLVATVVTDWTSGELLMVAYMNEEALGLTISTGIAHYYSRSRQELWKKGETSGALQTVREIRVDCDQDAVWLRVDVSRPEETCHTHRTTCFYRRVDRTGDGRTLIHDISQPQHKIPSDA